MALNRNQFGEQGTLFSEQHSTPDPLRLTPQKWLDDNSRGPIVFHSSRSAELPTYDRPSEAGGSGYSSVDTRQRRMVAYGSAVGMHWGTVDAAATRPGRDFVHTSRIPPEIMHGGVNNHPLLGPRPAEEYEDSEANYSDELTDAVEQGKAVAYTNAVEDRGSISYRARPDAVRTWGEDVLADPHAHPELKEAARRGYNPMIDIKANQDEANEAENRARRQTPLQESLFSHEVVIEPTSRNEPVRSVSYHNMVEDTGLDYRDQSPEAFDVADDYIRGLKDRAKETHGIGEVYSFRDTRSRLEGERNRRIAEARRGLGDLSRITLRKNRPPL